MVYDWLNRHIPARYKPVCWRTYFSLTPLSGAGFQALRLIGPLRNTGEPASILIASRSNEQIDYLKKRFFASEPQQKNLPTLRWWNLRLALTQAAATTDDLVFCELGHYLAPPLLGDDFLLSPGWVGLKSEIPSDPVHLKKMLNRVDGDLHLIRRHKLYSTIDSDLDSANEFYQNFYLPTASSRHGDNAIQTALASLLQGTEPKHLIWIQSGNKRIAGVLGKIEGSTLILTAIGIRNGDESFLKQGALAACYYESVLAARRLNCSHLDFRACRASLGDGVLAYKRKWGASLYQIPEIDFITLAIHWSRPSAALQALFEYYRPIFRTGNQILAAQIGKQHYPPGLSRVLELSKDDLPKDPADLIGRLA